MGKPTMVLAGAASLAFAFALGLGTAGAESTLDGHPSTTTYLSNDAPFVVFGVTPTRLDRQAAQLRLSFIATDRLSQVNVFPFVRSSPRERALLRSAIPCGPRDAGSWDCLLPVGALLRELGGPGGEIGLRIEAHGDPRLPAQHSTVVVIVPVGPEVPTATRPGQPPPQRGAAPSP
jgi:hypothetical protein